MSFLPETDARRARPRPFVVAWALMLVGAGASVLTAFLHLGVLAPILEFGIAALQALTVYLLFMRLKSKRGLRWVFAVTGFVWLSFLFGLSMADYATRRGWPEIYDPAGPSFGSGHSRGPGAGG